MQLPKISCESYTATDYQKIVQVAAQGGSAQLEWQRQLPTLKEMWRCRSEIVKGLFQAGLFFYSLLKSSPAEPYPTGPGNVIDEIVVA